MVCNTKIYFHTNIIAPYRLHQFRQIAEVFPNVVFCLNGILDDDGENVWDRHPEEKETYEWIRIAEQNTATSGKGRGNFSLRFFRLLVSQKWGTVHVVGDGLCRWNGFLLLLSALVGHSRVYWWNDGYRKDQVEREGKPSWKRRFLMKHILSGAWVNGRWGIEMFAKRGMPKNRIANQYFSCDDLKYRRYLEEEAVADREKVRRELGIDASDASILNVARHLEWKRLRDLAQALTLLERDFPDLARKCHLVMIGGGEYDDHSEILDALAKVAVHKISPLPADEVLKYYAAADVFAFPSEGDVWGVVINEALSMGLPVICTDVIGSAELVEDGVNGYVVPPRSPAEMAKRIALLASDPDRLGKMKENARASMAKWTSLKGVEALAELINGVKRR